MRIRLVEKKIVKICFMISLIHNNCIAEIKDTTKFALPSVPKMWVPKDISIKRREFFLTGVFNKPTQTLSKFQILGKTLGFSQAFIFYPIGSIEALLIKMDQDFAPPKIQALRIYIAAYDSDDPLASGAFVNFSDKTLMLIFAPIDASGRELGSYIIRPDNGIPEKIDSDHKLDWTNYYTFNCVNGLQGLVTTIDPNAIENKYSGHFSDTKAILYKNYSDVKEVFIQERSYQATLNNIVSGIEFDFAAFDEKGVDARPEHGGPNDYKGRLLFQFEFTKKNPVTNKDEVFYIDDQLNFCSRSGSNCGSPLSGESKKGFDTGNLCPPICK